MDEGIFKTGRTGLVSGRRVDIQWMWEIEKRAARMQRASRPPKGTVLVQLKLPMKSMDRNDG